MRRLLALLLLLPSLLAAQVKISGTGKLSGTGTVMVVTPPTAVAVPTTLAFGSIVQGASSASQTVNLTNTGTTPLTIVSIVASAQYSQTNNCPATLAAGSPCAILVVFSPTGLGSIPGTLTITDNSTTTPHVTTLSGTGTSSAPAIVSLNPTSLNFGTQQQGTTSASQPITLQNTGGATLTVSSIAASSQYSQTNNCPASLGPSASCTINVSFSPAAIGLVSGSLTVTDSATGSPHSVPLSGTGTAAGSLVLPQGLGWFQLPNMEIALQKVVAPATGSNNACPVFAGSVGPCAKAVEAWGTGVYDPLRHGMWILGIGGHVDYNGDEDYFGNLISGNMERLTNPSPNPGDCVESNSTSGKLVRSSTHTYDGEVLMSDYDTVFQTNGGFAGSTPCGSVQTWTFALSTKTWAKMDPMNGAGGISCFQNVCATAYDPVTKLVFIDDQRELYKYDFPSNTTTQITSTGAINTFNGITATISNVGGVRKFWAIGNGNILAIDITNPTGTLTVTHPTFGASCNALTTAEYPGLQFDPSQHLIVGWPSAGNTVLTFDPTTVGTINCATVTPAGTGPGSGPFGDGSCGNCTFKRFAYVPEANVFMLVPDYNVPTQILRLTNTVITSFQLTSPNNGTFPFTVGLGFKKGDVPAGASLGIANSQMIVKSTWNDGSAKMAIASGRVPLAANTPLTVNVLAGAASGGTALTCASIQAAAPSASIQFGAVGTVNLSALLAAPFRTWVTGSEMVECHYRSAVGADPTLQAWFHVRLYADGRMWVRAVAENGLLDVSTSDKSYVPTVIIGGTTVFSNGGASLTHYAHTRWNADGWIGGDPQITPKHDARYLEAAKLVPNYMNLTPSATALNNLGQVYTPMVKGGTQTTMSDTGFQDQIGVLPLWDAMYITSNADSRAYASVVMNAKAINAYPIVWEDSATHVTVIPSGRPTWTAFGNNAGGGTAIGAGPYTWDIAHHGSAGYLAYLITGDYYYLETLEDEASLCYLMIGSTNGSGTSRPFLGQTRAIGWCFRTVGQLAGIGGTDTVPSDYRSLYANNASHYRAVAQQANMNTLGFIASQEGDQSVYSTTNTVVAPWQQDFVTMSVGHTIDLEPVASMTDILAVQTYVAQSAVGRLGPNGTTNWCFTEAAWYNIQTQTAPAQPVTNYYPDWGTTWLNNVGSPNTACANTLGTNPNTSPPANAASTYWGNLLPAISYMVDHGQTGAAASWARLTGATNWSVIQNAGFADVPIWGVIPR